MAAISSSLAQPAFSKAAAESINTIKDHLGNARVIKDMPLPSSMRTPGLRPRFAVALYAIGAKASPALFGSRGRDPVIPGIGEKRAQQLIVQGMAGLPALEPRDHRVSGKLHVTNRIQNLVADELIGEAPQFRIEEHVSVDHERVGEIGPAAI